MEQAVTLANGVRMPRLGLGTWKSPNGVVEQAIRWALDAGYRHIDTAAAYGNEQGVGRAIRESGLPRGEIFLATKLWNEDQRKGPEAVRQAFETSLATLGLDYVDLYLVHWPVQEKYKDSWKVMEEIYRSGKARAIGVSNFMVHHLEDLLSTAQDMPQVNQVEFHPLLRQQELLDYCAARGMIHEAWSPLIRGKTSEIPELLEIARRHGKTPEQVTLRWELQKGSVVIPKSTKLERILSNSAIFDFELTPDDMQQIDRLDRNQRTGPDPDNFAF